jgi:hypothetical protein
MKIIMLAGKGDSTRYIYNGVSENYEIDKVLLTDTPSKKYWLNVELKN